MRGDGKGDVRMSRSVRASGERNNFLKEQQCEHFRALCLARRSTKERGRARIASDVSAGPGRHCVVTRTRERVMRRRAKGYRDKRLALCARRDVGHGLHKGMANGRQWTDGRTFNHVVRVEHVDRSRVESGWTSHGSSRIKLSSGLDFGLGLRLASRRRFQTTAARVWRGRVTWLHYFVLDAQEKRT